MPKKVSALTDRIVQKLAHNTNRTGEAIEVSRKVAYHAVGNPAGLLLQCRDSGSRSWIMRTWVKKTRRIDVGLGGYPDVSLAEAREEAKRIKRDALKGIDEVAQRREAERHQQVQHAKQVTFRDISQDYVARKQQEFGGRNPHKQMQKLENQLSYVNPVLADLVIGTIHTTDVAAALEEVWRTKSYGLANDTRRHVERIFDIAKVKKLYEGENPATLRAVTELLPKPRGKKASRITNRPALPVEVTPKLYAELMTSDTLGSKALAFQILTAVRPGEARHAEWDHIDFDNRLWTIPAEVMKMGEAHEVPLSDAAIAILEAIPRLGRYVFSQTGDKPISDMTANKALKSLHAAAVKEGGVGYVDIKGSVAVAHGFRSTFRDWSAEFTSYPDKLAERALAHKVGDSVENAYARARQVEKRRPLMQDWADFCQHGRIVAGNNVTPIRGGRQG